LAQTVQAKNARWRYQNNFLLVIKLNTHLESAAAAPHYSGTGLKLHPKVSFGGMQQTN